MRTKRLVVRVVRSLPGPLRAAAARYPRTVVVVVGICAATPLPIISTLVVVTASWVAVKRIVRRTP
jgi:hypothetical protein